MKNRHFWCMNISHIGYFSLSIMNFFHKQAALDNKLRVSPSAAQTAVLRQKQRATTLHVFFTYMHFIIYFYFLYNFKWPIKFTRSPPTLKISMLVLIHREMAVPCLLP